MAEARAAKGLTQKELAAAADVSRETVNRAENQQNVPEAEKLARIAKALDICLDSLFEETHARPA